MSVCTMVAILEHHSSSRSIRRGGTVVLRDSDDTLDTLDRQTHAHRYGTFSAGRRLGSEWLGVCGSRRWVAGSGSVNESDEVNEHLQR